MSSPLYYNHETYLLIIQKGTAWNIVMEYGSFTTKCIGNDDLKNMLELELNEENIKLLFSTNNNLNSINIDNFDINQYFYYKNNRYYIYSWIDIFNFANGKL